MDFTIDFLFELGRLLLYILPLLIALTIAISGLALWIGKQEGWPVSDSLYYGFITATTVGYGDFHPTQSRCKYLAIVIALLGLILTGILVAVSVEAVSTVVDSRAEKFSTK
jgi:hypothetical protein